MRPVAEDASAAAAPVEQRVEVLDRDALLADERADDFRLLAPTPQEEVGVGVSRTDLSA